MRVFWALTLLCSLQTSLISAYSDAIGLSDGQRKFSDELAGKFQATEKSNAHAIAGADGWLFLSSELRLLSVGCFWGDDAAKVSRSTKPENADPVPAILDFHDQLKQRGIELILVPVPPKAAIYPEKIVPQFNTASDDSAPYLHRFYDELRSKGVEVLDLAAPFLQHRYDEGHAVFCQTDTHWSGTGCVMAAQAMAKKVREKIAADLSRNQYAAEWRQIEFSGDLTGFLPSGIPKPAPEKIYVRTVRAKATGEPIQPDSNSPVLLLGDSHTLVFHDFLAESAGLIDQLAQELGFAVDLIGTRGSGATSVRVALYRRSHKYPDYLKKKKMIIWCFAAREFTETDGWAKTPVSK